MDMEKAFQVIIVVAGAVIAIAEIANRGNGCKFLTK